MQPESHFLCKTFKQIKFFPIANEVRITGVASACGGANGKETMATNILEMNTGPRQAQFREQMQAFADWKAELTSTINQFHDWLNQHDLANPELELRIYDAVKALQNDQLSIAFVAEFSRGKTELINAIFFADYGRRLLPSEAGRTTMCPTELFYDTVADESYIKLLPIESRLSDISLSELKHEDSHWTRLPLDTGDPDQMADTVREIVKTKMVPVEEAEKLGLFHGDAANAERDGTSRQSEIPVWRHALISFPHPLLKQGLVILDTPGLNALGSEPELTLNMLPSAQAVLFVLSADTGVTRSDLDMWQNHIIAFRNHKQRGLVAVLNKIDTLWDEMKQPAEVAATIGEQCKATANLLGIDAGNVFPVSAQKALLAKTRGNEELLARSNLTALENLLGNEILPDKQNIVWDNTVAGVETLITEARAPLAAQIGDLDQQIEELASLRGNNEEVVQHLLIKAKEKKAAYYECVKSFQLNRRKLALQAKSMFNTLDIKAIDRVIEKTRKEMSGSWTTPGMKNGMLVFFDSLRDAMQIITRQAEETHALVESIYKKFNEEFNLDVPIPRKYPAHIFSSDLDQLYLKSEEFRHSSFSTIGEQSFVVKKFFVSLVSHARQIFLDANKEADTWMKEIINPLVNQIQEKRKGIEQHMKTLSKIRESKNSVEGQLRVLKQRRQELDDRIVTLRQMQDRLKACAPAPHTFSEAPSTEKSREAI